MQRLADELDDEPTTRPTEADRRAGPRAAGGAWLWAERLAWGCGIAAIGFWAIAGVSGRVGAHRELERFEALQSETDAVVGSPDLSLWSPERIRAWQDSQKRAAYPLAVLRIPRIGLEVPVLGGTDEWTLNRAVGHIEDTARPGAEGNSGIAGHRDGFFRGLKDVHSGDVLEIDTLGSTDRYRVERTWIVQPEDVSVLEPTMSPSVTLVTCYPFYFVGSAPQRFIVRAVRTESAPRGRAPHSNGTRNPQAGRRGTPVVNRP
jgi:sortase A